MIEARKAKQAAITTPSDREIRVERVFDAPRERVWQALTDLGDRRTRLVTVSLFHTQAERDGMLQSGMEGGLNESYAALDRVLARQVEGTRARGAAVSTTDNR